MFVQSIWRQRDGIAALEFAIVAPLAIYIILAYSDIVGGITTTGHMTKAVDTIAQLVSQQTEGGSSTQAGTPTSTITNAYILEDFASLLTTLPDVMGDATSKNEDWTSDVQAIVSSVEFGPTSQGCVIEPPPAVNPTDWSTVCTPYVVWSVGFANSSTGYTTSTRACGQTAYLPSNTASPTLTAVAPGAATPGTSLAPGTMIVADLQFTFTPTFTKWLTGSFTFQRTAYFPPRFFTQLNYTPPSSTPTVNGNQNLYPSSTAGGLSSCTFNGTVPTVPAGG